MSNMCRGRSPSQPCCFAVGAAAGGRVPDVDVCVFCNKDKLSVALKDKSCVDSVLDQLRKFSNEARLCASYYVYLTA